MFIYDIEIRHAIATKQAEKNPGYKYCSGFDDFANMGIACICAYDYQTDKFRVFGQDELDAFRSFADSHDTAVGYNNIRFDNCLLADNSIVIPPHKTYDILAEIYSALGSYQKGCRLDDVVKANFPNNSGKSGNGADAPLWWQDGLYTKVIDYCLNDVRLTKKLLDKIIRFGYLNNPVRPGEFLPIRRP